MQEKSVTEAAFSIDLRIDSVEENLMSYLNFMSQNLHAIRLSQKDNGLFVTSNFK